MKIIKKIWFRLRYDRRVLVILSLFILTSIILGSFYFVFYKVFDAERQVQFLRSRPYLVKLLPVIRSVRKVSDVLYLPYYFQKSELPVYELYINPADIEKINESLPLGFGAGEVYINKKYVPAKFWADGREYNVDVRYRGDNSIHWESSKKSYLIKFDKNDLFNGYRRLSFIIADDRKFIVESLNNYRAGKLDLYYPRDSFATLKINGRNNGLYFVIENWSQEMLAKWGVPDSANLYSDVDSVIWLSQNSKSIIWDTLGAWDKKNQDELLSYNNFSEIDKLFDLVNNANDKFFYESIFDLVDKDSFFNWLVHQNLVSSNHQGPGNLRLYFNNTSGKFLFIPWDVDIYDFDKMIDGEYSILIDRILSNPEYIYERNKRLWQYIANKDNLEDDLNFYDQTYIQIKPALYQDRMKVYTNKWADNLIEESRAWLVKNFGEIKETLKKHRAFIEIRVNLSEDYNNLNQQNILSVFDIKVDNFSELSLENLVIPLNDTIKSPGDYLLYYDKNFNQILDSEDKLLTKIVLNSDNDKELINQINIDTLLFTNRKIEDVSSSDSYQLELTNHRFFLISRDNKNSISNWQIDKIKFVIKNAITGKKLKKGDIINRVVDEEVFANFFYINRDIDSFLNKYPFFTVNKNKKEIVLRSGSYNINQTIIIPKNYSLKIEAGVNLYFAPEVSLISYGSVLAQGTKDKPIKITGQNKNVSWGVFGVLGLYAKESIFEYCLFEGGKEAYINGVFYSGQLAVHYTDVVIKNCQFQLANGDDGLNVKNGKVEIKNNIFNKNKFDGLDLDLVTGVVANNYFINNGQKIDMNGDGLDLSGSKDLIIFNNKFKNSPDKCLSVGEESRETTIIFNNLFSGCNIGIAVKDNSKVKIINNVIVNNKIGISVYEKKPVFGGSWPVVINTIIWNNDKSISLDEKSNITVSYSDIQNGYGGENNFNQEPLFQNLEQDNFLLLNNQQNSALINGGYTEVVNTILNKQLEIVPIGLFNLFLNFYD